MEIDKANFIAASSERIDKYYEIKNKKEDVSLDPLFTPHSTTQTKKEQILKIL